MPLLDRFKRLTPDLGRVRERIEQGVERFRDRLPASPAGQASTPAPPARHPPGQGPGYRGVPPTKYTKVPHPAPPGAPPKPAMVPADLWDNRGWVHFNIGDQVEFSAADGSGVSVPIASKKWQDDRADWTPPEAAHVPDGTLGEVVALRGPNPVVYVEAAGDSFGYRFEDVFNLTPEGERRWGHASSRHTTRDATSEGVLHEGMRARASPPLRDPSVAPPAMRRQASSASDIAAWMLEDLIVQPLQGPRGSAWFAYPIGGKAYAGRVFTDDPGRMAANYLNATYEFMGAPLVPKETLALAKEARTAIWPSGREVHRDIELRDAIHDVMVDHQSRGELCLYDDAVRLAWAGLGRSLPVTAKLVVEDRRGVFAGARPAYDVAELPPEVVGQLAAAAELTKLQEVFVTARTAGTATSAPRITLQVSGTRLRERTLTETLFE